ncbi:MAG TPA: S4 domain-containing protein [Thermoanaerobaculia bacterium]|nr:S4 domain-containing protein [Thermoanaerobaculia bacterium]
MERHRLDVWLKLVCLFRHRADATEACKGGHVKLNGVRVKPAAAVKQGDLVELFSGDAYRRVVVQGLPESNISKEIARTMYIDETPVREKIVVVAKVLRERGAGRPTKKERREMDKWKR